MAWYLAREAARDGWDVEALTSDIGGRLPAEECLDGVAVRRVRAPKRKWAAHTVPELIAYYRAARLWLDRRDVDWQPDFTLAHFTYPAGLLARRLRQRRGIPYAVVLHGSDVPGYQPDRFGLFYPLLKPVARRVWRDARRVIAVSRGLAGLGRRTWPEGRFEVIENGVDITRYHPSASARSAESGAPLRLIVVAQCIRRKGLHHLAEALGGLPDALRNRFVLDVYGAGPEQDRLRRQCARAGVPAVFHGVVGGAALAEAYREADLFVLPSLAEGFPLAVLEAMASGLSVIVTTVGDLPFLVQNGHNGALVPPGNVQALRETLLRLGEDPRERARMGREARKTAEQFDWRKVWTRYADCL